MSFCWYAIPQLCYLLLSVLVVMMNRETDCCGNTECSICLDALKKDGEETVTTYECNHDFHVNCLNSWVQKSPSCPLCRHSLKVVKA